MLFMRMLIITCCFVLTANIIYAGPATPWDIESIDMPYPASGQHYKGSHLSIQIAPHPDNPYLDIAHGNTFISYYDATAQDLMVAISALSDGNCGENNTWKCETVDSAGDVGQFNSLAIHPSSWKGFEFSIAYVDRTNNALKLAEYRWGTSPYGYRWFITTIMPAAADTRLEDVSLAYDTSGIPHIAYYVKDTAIPGPLSNTLYYAYRKTHAGNCGIGNNWQCDVIQSESDSPAHGQVHLRLDKNNKAHIAYSIADSTSQSMQYAYGPVNNGGNCSSGHWYCHTLDGLGSYSSLVVDNSVSSPVPHIAHLADDGTVKYAFYVGAGGNCGAMGATNQWQCADIDTDGFHGVSIALDGDHNPVIAYQKSPDYEPSALMTAYPAFNGNCGPQEGLLRTWQCNTIDSGNSVLDEGSSIAIDMSSNGYGAIAYYEEDSYYATGRLKTAAQYHTLNVKISGKGMIATPTSTITSCETPSFCNEYPAGTTVSLDAFSLADNHFRGWSSEECSGIGPCQVLMDSSKSIIARFTPFQWNLFFPAMRKSKSK